MSGLGVFTAGFAAAGEDLAQVRVQISRWVKNGKVVRLHKGLYTLAQPYRKVEPEPFCVANSLKKASCVSLQSALAWYGMIPEYVPTVTSVTTGRGQAMETPVGRFMYRHIERKYFWGYQRREQEGGQSAFVATAEKALLDLVYLTPAGDEMEYLKELRLQNFEQVSRERLRDFARRFGSPKMRRAAENIERILDEGEGVEL